MGNNRSITGWQLFGALGAMGVAAVGAGLLGGRSTSRTESSPQADDSAVSGTVQIDAWVAANV